MEMLTAVSQEVETVRCVIQNGNGEVLLLQKAADSKAANLFELPGGRIDGISGQRATLPEQLAAVFEEVRQETGLHIARYSPKKATEFAYQFTIGSEQLSRRVHLFFVAVPGTPEVMVNRTKNGRGESEDKHAGFLWASRDQLHQMQTQGKLSGNSQHFGFYE